MPDGIIAAADQVAPQLEIARAFVAALTGSPKTPIRVRMIHDAKAREFQSVEARDTIERLWPGIVEFQRRGYGCFYFLNETAVPEGRQYARDADVTAIRALAIDADASLPDEMDWHAAPRSLSTRAVPRAASGGKCFGGYPTARSPISALHRLD